MDYWLAACWNDHQTDNIEGEDFTANENKRCSWYGTKLVDTR